MEYANLAEACLIGANNVPYMPQTIIVPESGSFVGWKKVKNSGNEFIIKLLIPENARRSNGTWHKGRCNAAIVLEIQNLDGTKADVNHVINTRFKPLDYKIGNMVFPDYFDDDRWNDYSHGIHFFITRKEAVDFQV